VNLCYFITTILVHNVHACGLAQTRHVIVGTCICFTQSKKVSVIYILPVQVWSRSFVCLSPFSNV